MKRLGITLIFIFAIIMSATVLSFANPKKEEVKPIPVEEVTKIAKEIKVEEGFINKPKDFSISTVNDTLVLSGTGKENDRVKITMYKRDGENFVVMGDSIEIKIGPLGVFTKELSLKDGSQKSPKEAVVSKETLIVLELKRGEVSVWDYRFVRFSNDKEVKRSLDAIPVTPAIGAK
ncbi:MAG: hypothetical protein Q4A75_07495 [Peptostreptococcaceae bacterium]|nr:hypothetical protein [Peptostreptococcaceae bacterium]